MDKIEIKRLQFEQQGGSPGDPRLNERRALVVAKAASHNTTVGKGVIPHGEWGGAEVYMSDLGKLAKRVRTSTDRAVYEMCKEQERDHLLEFAHSNKKKVKRPRGLTDEEWLNYLREPGRSNIHWAQFLKGPRRKGLPPLEEAYVLKPEDESQRIPLHDFLELSDAEQRAWTMDPPVNDQNREIVAGEAMGASVERAIEKAIKAFTAQGGRRKRNDN